MLLLILAATSADWINQSDGWTDEVSVREAGVPVVRFSARVEGNVLLVRAKHGDGWHTYAMDNEIRANRALKGKKSLGVEEGISITTPDGEQLKGVWRQSKPRDLSKPELRWYTFGFEKTAVLSCEFDTPTAIPGSLRIRGQACSGETCLPIDLRISSVADDAAGRGNHSLTDKHVADLLKTLVKVENSETSRAGKTQP